MSITPPFPERGIIRKMTAHMLLEAQAVQVNIERPYILTTGWASPVYIDCRRLISFPRIRRDLMEFATATILRDIGNEQLDTIAGGETAGVPFAAWIADRLMLPMQIVRKQPKGFGPSAQIDGVVDGGRTLLVEDVTTDGRSKVNFCEALRRAGANIEHAFVIFQYGIFPHAQRSFDNMGLKLHYLATWWDVLDAAKSQNSFELSILSEVEKFLNDPAAWSARHGGIDRDPSLRS